MGRDDWYRNKRWDAETEAAFRDKLSRSRGSRPQYLQIQASHLTECHPLVALKLIEEYFSTDDQFNRPIAFSTKARALCALGRINQSVAAYKQALEWERIHPHHISVARIELPKLVTNHRISNEYDYALEILATRFSPMDHQFPTTRYEWNGCNALIAKELGRHAEAQEFAERALRAAAQTESPFRYHRTVGLVRDSSDEFGRRLKRVVRHSMLRKFLRLIARK
jgi:tetratricopeptide (TPR) repeat protein